MKSKLIYTTVIIAAATLISCAQQRQGGGRGMPPEERQAIHGLFDAHQKIERKVTKTAEGYTSKTTSTDPAVVKILQTHVKQMETRLKKGLMVRRWDPAYVEFVNHYDDIQIKITNIDNGISVVAIGKTEAAKKVARNHAGIIGKFIKHGWSEHHKKHAPALQENSEDKSITTTIIAVSAPLAQKKLQADSEIIIVDMRTAKEFAEGHLPKAINLDMKSKDFSEKLAKLDRNTTYLVHCRSGARSTKSLPTWKELGFKKLLHLDSGFLSWEKAKLPVTKE